MILDAALAWALRILGAVLGALETLRPRSRRAPCPPLSA